MYVCMCIYIYIYTRHYTTIIYNTLYTYINRSIEDDKTGWKKVISSWFYNRLTVRPSLHLQSSWPISATFRLLPSRTVNWWLDLRSFLFLDSGGDGCVPKGHTSVLTVSPISQNHSSRSNRMLNTEDGRWWVQPIEPINFCSFPVRHSQFTGLMRCQKGLPSNSHASPCDMRLFQMHSLAASWGTLLSWRQKTAEYDWNSPCFWANTSRFNGRRTKDVYQVASPYPNSVVSAWN